MNAAHVTGCATEHLDVCDCRGRAATGPALAVAGHVDELDERARVTRRRQRRSVATGAAPVMTLVDRRRAAIAAWTVRRYVGCSWRESLRIGMASIERVSRDQLPELAIDERVAEMWRAGQVSEPWRVGWMIVAEWLRAQREARAYASSRLDVDRAALVRLHAEKRGALTWGDLALLSTAARRNDHRPVYIDRRTWEQTVARVVAEWSGPPSLGLLMGLDGEP